MAQQSDHLGGPLYGQANQPAQAGARFLVECTDATLLARKGRLYALCYQDVTESALVELRQHYYADTSFDLLPSLSAALVAVHEKHAGSRQAIPLALVVLGLDLLAVGTGEGVIWLARSDETRELDLSQPLRRGSGVGQRPGMEVEAGARLYGARWRLYAGDMLVVTTREVRRRLSPVALRSFLRAAPSATAAAQRVARAAPRGRLVPVMVIRIPGFSPVPDLGPALKWAAPRPARAQVRSEQGMSPLWPALFVAIVAVAISLWIKRPEVSRASLSELFVWMLTPVPTATPTLAPVADLGVSSTTAQPAASRPVRSEPTRATKAKPAPTSTPTASPTVPSYPLVEMLSPRQGEEVKARFLTLRWAWSGTLAPDEYFDVRLWREGGQPGSIAWSKERSYTERYFESGRLFWTVVVIRGKDGALVRELSAQPKAVSFLWWREIIDEPPPAATPAPTVAPTRSTPVSRPTRVTPEP